MFAKAQTNKQHSLETLKQKELDIKRKSDFTDTKSSNLNTTNDFKSTIKPTVIVGSKQYDLVKAEGRLAHYEIVKKEGKVVSVEKTTFTSSGKVLTSTLTPCDIVPPGTTAPFAATVDDDTYFNETGSYINLPFTFCFYGNNYTEVNYSTNGNIQFPPTNIITFSSFGFPAPTDIMIAPFWADLDNRGTGTYGFDIFPTYAVFSWINVGYFNSQTDLTNDFQMVITDGLDPILPPGKNVGFYYGTMQWTTGDASSGVGGFPNPTITPAIPATVGANAGNGIDYFLIGRFGQAGSAYDGPLGADDGVSWLDGKTFYFNACPPVGSNAEPLLLSNIDPCQEIHVCGNDTVYEKITFSGPEASQTVTVSATAPTLGTSFTYSTISNTNSTDIYLIINGTTASPGNHIITVTATDNGVPAQTSVQIYSVNIDQISSNNLNGSITLTPTLGACPGQTVMASVNISGGVPDSYFWSNNATTSTTSFTTVVAADSLIFVTLQSGVCRKTIVGDININPVPIANISGNLTFCNGNASSTVLTATNTLNPSSQGPHAYNWAGTGTLSSTITESTSVNAGVYTVTVTNQFGCISVTTTTVVMNETPSYTLTSANAVSGGSVYCVNQDTARIAISFGGGAPASCGLANAPCVTSNTIQVGTLTNTGSATAYTPYNGTWESSHHQYLYRASELLAAGVQAGKLSSLAFNITNLNGGNTSYANFAIKLKCTSDNVLTNTSMDVSGLSQVFSTPLLNVAIGWNTHTFSQSYEWDGISNLLVDVCYFDLNWNGNNAVQYTNVGYNAVRNDFDVNDICGTTSLAGVSQNRPNTIFSNCLSQQSGAQFNIVVTPTLGVVIPTAHDSIKFDLPSISGTTCYTVSLINPIGSCSKDTVICVQAIQGVTQGTLVATPSVVCIGSPVTLSSLGSLSTYTISYNNGSLVNSINNPVTFNSAISGTNTYTLQAQGFCGAPIKTYTTTVLVNSLLNLSITPMSNVIKCLNSSVTLTANVASSVAEPYTYNWSPAIGTSTNSTYITSTPVTTTFVVTVNGFCANTATSSVVVSNFATDINVSIIDSVSICANTELVLNTLTTGGKPPYLYNWTILPDINSISTSYLLNTTAPATEGTYSVMFVSTDSCGFTDFDTQVINVLPPCDIIIPNIITPNGDGANDYFVIKNIEYHSNSALTIFDRWGKKVFVSSNYSNEWKGNGLNDGTYFYVVDVPDDKTYNGFVQILR